MRRLVALAVLAAALVVPGARAAAPVPALFRVGAATVNIDPPVPVYAGGFGVGPAIRRVSGHLQVRAFYISNGSRAVAFAAADAQGWFAAYQQDANLGIDGVRAAAATTMSRLGPAMSSADIIVQATHSHSAPTLEGIWGPTPTSYLTLVHDRAVQALTAAARSARPAHLQWSSLDAPQLDNIATAQYDSFPGWSQDGQVSVLRALDATTGATIGTYANIPAHPDIVCGACLKTLTADYFGAVRDALDVQLGGTSLVTPATLGREETPVQATSIAQMRWYGDVVRSLVLTALGRPHWVTDPILASAQSTAHIPGTNAALLALVAANHAPEAVKQQTLATAGQYPINRADTPPYQVGNVIATPLTALRIGPLAYLSMPGEPFPEVTVNLAAAIHGAALVVSLSKAQDDLGYFYPAWVAPFASAIYPTDQGTFSVAPQAGDQIMQGQLAGVGALGFGTDPLAVPKPLPTDYAQALKPGLQALAAPAEGDGQPVVMEAIYAPADQNGNPLAGQITWDLGDGSHARTPALSFGGSCTTPNIAGNGLMTCPKTPGTFLTHRFRPGTWRVRLSGADTAGKPVSWAMTVVVHPRGSLVITRRGTRLTVTEHGGSGQLLAATWQFSRGTVERGLSAQIPAGEKLQRLQAIDSAGGQIALR
jgi:hypothetical protein